MPVACRFVGEETREQRIGASVALWRAGQSQQSLAARMRDRGHKWSQATVWSVEKGERPLRLSEAEDLADILGASLEALAGASPEAVTLRYVEQLSQSVSDRLGAALDALEGLAFDRDRLATAIGDDADLKAAADYNVNLEIVDDLLGGKLRFFGEGRGVTAHG